MEKITTAADSFLSSLVELPEADMQGVRLLKTKLFIAEHALSGITEFYKRWLALNGAGSYSDEKIISRIFGREKMPLYYLPEGNNCFVGYLATIPSEFESKKGKLPSSNSVPISAKDYLHPRDQSIKNIPGVEVRKPLNESTQYVIQRKDQKISLSENVLRKVVGVLRSSKKIQEKYPDIDRSLKDALIALKDILVTSKAVSKSRSQFVPQAYQAETFKFNYISGNLLVFKDDDLIDIFEVKGRGLSNLIDSEITYLADQARVNNIDVFQLLSKDSKVIGKLKITGKWYALERRAFRHLIEKIPFSRFFQGKLGSRYTVKNVLEAIIPALKNADWINVSGLGRNLPTDEKQKPKYELKFTPWTFVTGKNFIIIDFIESGAQTNPFKNNG